MAELPSSAHGATAASEKETFGKLHPPSRDAVGPLSAKKVRTEEKKMPRRLNGEGGSGGNSRQLQAPAAPSPQSYANPASWSFAALSAAPSPASARSSVSFSSSTGVPSAASASSSQPVPRKLLVPPTLLHAQPHHLLLPAAASSASAKPRRPKEKREKERRRHGLGGAGEAGGAARAENGEVKALPRGECRRLGGGEGVPGPRRPLAPAEPGEPGSPGTACAGLGCAGLRWGRRGASRSRRAVRQPPRGQEMKPVISVSARGNGRNSLRFLPPGSGAAGFVAFACRGPA